MTSTRRLLARLHRDRRGATIVEFGLIIIPLTFILLAILDLGFRTYVGAVLQGALQQASRNATIGTLSQSQLSALVQERLGFLVNAKYVTITNKSYYSFSRVGKPEKITTDVDGDGKYDTGDCYEDANGNKVYDTDAGSSGLGGSDDILYYQVTATFPRLVPLSAYLGWGTSQTVSSSTVLRNQPYASQATPGILCN